MVQPAARSDRASSAGSSRAITRLTGARPRHDDERYEERLSARAVSRRRAHLSLETTEPTPFGSGFISGLLSAILGIAGFGAVLCLRFPQYLTLRGPAAVLRARRTCARSSTCTLVASFLLGTRQRLPARQQDAGADRHRLHAGGRAARRLAGAGRRRRSRAIVARRRLLRAQPAALLGRLHPARAAVRAARRAAGVPPAVAGRPHVLLRQLAADRGADDPDAEAGADPVRLGAVGGDAVVGSLPLLVQVPALLLVADFTQYWVHRTFHAVPFLWPFHAIHHSVEEMDWLAGSRLHLVDVIVTRGLTYVPIFVLGVLRAGADGLRLPRRRAGHVHSRQRAVGRSGRCAGSSRRRRSTTGTTARSARRSTRTSRCTRRSGTCCSAPTTCPTAGPRRTGCQRA